MRHNEKGFSLIELLAILFITSALIAPLLSTLIGNIELNNRTQTRRNAASIAEGTLNGLQKIDFNDFDTQLGNRSTAPYYIEFNDTTCNTLTETSDQTICDEIFGAIWNNLTLDETEFKVYMFDYSLDPGEHASLSTNGSIEEEARNLILTDQDILDSIDAAEVPDLIRIVIWIDYYDDPDQYLTVTGLIFNE